MATEGMPWAIVTEAAARAPSRWIVKMIGYPNHLLAFDLLDRAEEFLRAYQSLPKTPPPSWPRYFLLCHSVEVALKAFVASRGDKSQDDLKSKYRHDITELLAEGTRLGLSIGPLARGELERLNEAHTKFWPRYPNELATPVFVIDQFEPYAEELLQAVRVALTSPRQQVTH